MTRLRWGALFGVLGVTLCACGTTVSSYPAAGGAVGGAPAGRGGVSQPLGPATAPTLAAAAASASRPAATGVTGAALAAATIGAAAATDKTIRLGLLEDPPYTPPGASTPTEDWLPIAESVVADLNKRGGLAGRRVIPVDWQYPNPPSNDQANVAWEQQQEAQACSYLTEDQHVFAVVALGSVAYSAPCYAEHHVPVFTSTITIGVDDRALQKLAPWILVDDTPDLDTRSLVLADALRREHFLDRHIGIAALDWPAYHRAIDQVLRPALARYGGYAANADIFYSALDPADGTNTARAATLRWKTDKVDRVILFGLPGQAWTVIAGAALAQGYVPRWGMDSQLEPEVEIDSGEVASLERNVVGAGWFPMFDVHDSDYPLRPTERHCLHLVNTALGTSYGHRKVGDGGAALISCRTFALVQQVMAAFTGKPLVADQLWGALHGLARSYHPLDMPWASFAPAKPDGLGLYRTFSYESACTCVRYDTPWMPLPSA